MQLMQPNQSSRMLVGVGNVLEALTVFRLELEIREVPE